MKKLFALAVLAVFALGFGGIVSAEDARGNSPLSKVEPMAKEEATAPAVEKKAVLVPEEEATPAEEEKAKDENVIAPEKEATDDLAAAPVKEDEAPKSDDIE